MNSFIDGCIPYLIGGMVLVAFPLLAIAAYASWCLLFSFVKEVVLKKNS